MISNIAVTYSPIMKKLWGTKQNNSNIGVGFKEVTYDWVTNIFFQIR